MKLNKVIPLVFWSITLLCNGQADSVHVPTLKPKVNHAEPLYIDLIRDLGARKGEREWNLGVGLTDNAKYDSYEALIEYEWAPIDRLGFEVELPFSFYSRNKEEEIAAVPSPQLNSLKLATQWSFFVNEKIATSMAIGYINEFLLAPFDKKKGSILTGNGYNPFFVIAKRWGNNFHTLIYTGPRFHQTYGSSHFQYQYDINTSFHYMIGQGRNFVGIELNKRFHTEFEMTIRPQMRLEISEHLMVGIVTGFPINKKNERFSAFLRLIYEPKHKK